MAAERQKINAKDGFNRNIDQAFHSYNHLENKNQFDQSPVTYTSEHSPDSTTRNICRICGKT